jgi:hypothetical protein
MLVGRATSRRECAGFGFVFMLMRWSFFNVYAYLAWPKMSHDVVCVPIMPSLQKLVVCLLRICFENTTRVTIIVLYALRTAFPFPQAKGVVGTHYPSTELYC